MLSDSLRSFQETYSDMAAISSSNTAFALDLLRILSQENPSGNIFVSPLSISSALAMVYLGAKGDTAAQMAQVETPGPLSQQTCSTSAKGVNTDHLHQRQRSKVQLMLLKLS